MSANCGISSSSDSITRWRISFSRTQSRPLRPWTPLLRQDCLATSARNVALSFDSSEAGGSSLELLIDRLGESKDNATFLAEVAKQS